jgi:hypothetical protein
MRLLAIILLTFTLFVSCVTRGVPDGILPPDKIQPIIFDLLRADEYVNNFVMRDTMLKREKEAVKLYEQVFVIHGITSADFYKSYRYYQAHPDKNRALFDSLSAFVSRKRQGPDTSNKNSKTIKNAL